MLAINDSGRTSQTIRNGTTMNSSASTTDSHHWANESQRERATRVSDNDYRIYERIFLVGIFAWTFGQLTFRLVSELPK